MWSTTRNPNQFRSYHLPPSVHLGPFGWTTSRFTEVWLAGFFAGRIKCGKGYWVTVQSCPCPSSGFQPLSWCETEVLVPRRGNFFIDRVISIDLMISTRDLFWIRQTGSTHTENLPWCLFPVRLVQLILFITYALEGSKCWQVSESLINCQLIRAGTWRWCRCTMGSH